ncbi:DUF7344 domain-containing protein [Natronobacterium texcoconense]|uniref:DUF7344 domain-containing protein n=1 Tax=Natronobacterium texcoconense TaxID=1095778 RepID=A0A1H1G6Y8_NATTX|nr:hypothetical protein [Natronobacterium texcoconense]SDR08961.1 hypothetical protein SAMN04489842_2292 [Natronobacterium texcoconense]
MSHPGTIDTVLEALADYRRRKVCEYLVREGTCIETADVVTHLSAELSTSSTASPTSNQRLEVGLHHVHLPLLDDADVLEYDDRANSVEPDRNLAVAETILEAVPENAAETA